MNASYVFGNMILALHSFGGITEVTLYDFTDHWGENDVRIEVPTAILEDECPPDWMLELVSSSL